LARGGVAAEGLRAAVPHGGLMAPMEASEAIDQDAKTTAVEELASAVPPPDLSSYPTMGELGTANAKVPLVQGDNPGMFSLGERVQYWSETLARWVDSTVISKHIGGGCVLYDLSCKKGTPEERLRPIFNNGDRVKYWSSSGRWVSAVLLKVHAGRDVCDLNVKRGATINRIRKVQGNAAVMMALPGASTAKSAAHKVAAAKMPSGSGQPAGEKSGVEQQHQLGEAPKKKAKKGPRPKNTNGVGGSNLAESLQRRLAPKQADGAEPTKTAEPRALERPEGTRLAARDGEAPKGSGKVSKRAAPKLEATAKMPKKKSRRSTPAEEEQKAETAEPFASPEQQDQDVSEDAPALDVASPSPEKRPGRTDSDENDAESQDRWRDRSGRSPSRGSRRSLDSGCRVRAKAAQSGARPKKAPKRDASPEPAGDLLNSRTARHRGSERSSSPRRNPNNQHSDRHESQREAGGRHHRGDVRSRSRQELQRIRRPAMSPSPRQPRRPWLHSGGGMAAANTGRYALHSKGSWWSRDGPGSFARTHRGESPERWRGTSPTPPRFMARRRERPRSSSSESRHRRRGNRWNRS